MGLTAVSWLGVALAGTTGTTTLLRVSRPPAGQPGHVLSWAITGNQESGQIHAKGFLKPLLMAYLLISHWPKQVTWPSLESEAVGTTQVTEQRV